MTGSELETNCLEVIRPKRYRLLAKVKGSSTASGWRLVEAYDEERVFFLARNGSLFSYSYIELANCIFQWIEHSMGDENAPFAKRRIF